MISTEIKLHNILAWSDLINVIAEKNGAHSIRYLLFYFKINVHVITLSSIYCKHYYGVLSSIINNNLSMSSHLYIQLFKIQFYHLSNQGFIYKSLIQLL